MVPCSLCWTVWSGSVMCRALPCRVPWSAGLWSVFEIYYVSNSRQSSKLQMVGVQGREIDEADLDGRMVRYQGTYGWKRQQQQGVGNHPAAVQGQYGCALPETLSTVPSRERQCERERQRVQSIWAVYYFRARASRVGSFSH